MYKIDHHHAPLPPLESINVSTDITGLSNQSKHHPAKSPPLHSYGLLYTEVNMTLRYHHPAPLPPLESRNVSTDITGLSDQSKHHPAQSPLLHSYGRLYTEVNMNLRYYHPAPLSPLDLRNVSTDITGLSNPSEHHPAQSPHLHSYG
jgi:hypothetical protein